MVEDKCSYVQGGDNGGDGGGDRSRKENLQLSSEYNKLQESYKHLEALKEKLASSELAWRQNLTDAQKDAEKSKQEVRDTHPPSSSSSSSSSSSQSSWAGQVGSSGGVQVVQDGQDKVDELTAAGGCCGLVAVVRIPWASCSLDFSA